MNKHLSDMNLAELEGESMRIATALTFHPNGGRRMWHNLEDCRARIPLLQEHEAVLAEIVVRRSSLMPQPAVA